HKQGVLTELPLPREQLLHEATEFVLAVERAVRDEITERLERVRAPALAAPFNTLTRARSEELGHFQTLVDVLEHRYHASQQDREARLKAWARRHAVIGPVIVVGSVLVVVLGILNSFFDLTDRLRGTDHRGNPETVGRTWERVEGAYPARILRYGG